jgi:hypothetical protein
MCFPGIRAPNDLSFDLGSSFDTCQNPQWSAKRPRFQGKTLSGGTSLHSPISLGNTTLYAVTPLQGSPLCPVPRPIRESSPHRLHYCILDPIDCPSIAKDEPWMFAACQQTMPLFRSSVSQHACSMQLWIVSIAIVPNFHQTIIQLYRGSALNFPSSHTSKIVQPR